MHIVELASVSVFRCLPLFRISLSRDNERAYGLKARELAHQPSIVSRVLRPARWADCVASANSHAGGEGTRALALLT